MPLDSAELDLIRRFMAYVADYDLTPTLPVVNEPPTELSALQDAVCSYYHIIFPNVPLEILEGIMRVDCSRNKELHYVRRIMI